MPCVWSVCIDLDRLNLARRFRPGKINMQETVLKVCSGNVNTIGQNEGPLKLTPRDTAVYPGSLGIISLLATNNQLIILNGYRQVLFGKPRNGKGNPKTTIIKLLNIVGRIAFLWMLRNLVEQALDLVKAQQQRRIEITLASHKTEQPSIRSDKPADPPQTLRRRNHYSPNVAIFAILSRDLAELRAEHSWSRISGQRTGVRLQHSGIAFRGPKAYGAGHQNSFARNLEPAPMVQPQHQKTSPKPVIWLQDRIGGKIRRKHFRGFEGEIRCDDPQTFADTAREVERLRSEGKHLAGFISYEAGYLTEDSLARLLPEARDVPLVWMGVFDTVEEETVAPRPLNPPARQQVSAIETLEAELTRKDYTGAIHRTLDYIKAGDIYQANFTYRSSFNWSGDPLDLFESLTATQPVPYAAYIDTGQEVILSLSPELFFDISDGVIRTRPMKGTARRGRTTDEDRRLADALARDPKERAENLMILDLMRNDLSRITAPGSVMVPERFTVERYRTVHQMTSSVEARLQPGTDFPALLGALFPCGSITGAPKVRAMEIISELEHSPRGVYTGAIGHLDPGGDAAFNVAIRTLTLKPRDETRQEWRGSVGVGGGIVYDSTPEREFEECQIKIAFLDRPNKEPVQLIETMKAEAGDIFLLREHLARLEDSARYFDFPCATETIRDSIEARAASLGAGPWRLRLLLSADGSFDFTDAPLEARQAPLRFTIASTRVSSDDLFLFHKTTRRALFDETLTAEAARCGADEVLFLNERGELTEGSRSNIFLRKNGVLLTPPLASGCLPGTLRAHLLANPGTQIVEQVLTLADLDAADEILFGNSLRGLESASLLSEDLRLAGE